MIGKRTVIFSHTKQTSLLHFPYIFMPPSTQTRSFLTFKIIESIVETNNKTRSNTIGLSGKLLFPTKETRHLCLSFIDTSTTTRKKNICEQQKVSGTGPTSDIFDCFPLFVEVGSYMSVSGKSHLYFHCNLSRWTVPNARALQIF